LSQKLWVASGRIRCFFFRFTLVEPRAFKPKHLIRARPIIFPRNRRAEFDQLRRGKPLAEAGPQLVGHLRRRGGDSVGQFQHQLLVGIKQIAFAVPVQIADLLVTQSCRLTCGRVDVNSKRALNQLGGTNLPENFELVVNQIHLFQGLAELCVGNQKIRMSGNGLQWSNVLAQTLTRELSDDVHFELLKHLHLITDAKPKPHHGDT
jgi:hypothetical protein